MGSGQLGLSNSFLNINLIGGEKKDTFFQIKNLGESKIEFKVLPSCICIEMYESKYILNSSDSIQIPFIIDIDTYGHYQKSINVQVEEKLNLIQYIRGKVD